MQRYVRALRPTVFDFKAFPRRQMQRLETATLYIRVVPSDSGSLSQLYHGRAAGRSTATNFLHSHC